MREATRKTKGQILSAAEDCFVKFGPRKTSMEDIAHHAGLARATVYLHFANKKSLYRELLLNLRNKLLDEMQLLVGAEQKAAWKLQRFVELTIDTYSNSALLFGALSNDPDMAIEKIAEEVMVAQDKAMTDLIKAILLQGIEMQELRNLDPDRTAYLMHQLGKRLVLDELGGDPKYKLKDILPAMNDLLAFGLIRRESAITADKSS